MKKDSEIWKPIKGYEGCYEVSNKGRVKSLIRKVNANNGGIYIKEEMYLSPVIDSKGYYQVFLCKNGKPKPNRIHRLVAETFIDKPNGKNIVNHMDKNKSNNCVENLEWCTNQYNLRYSTSKSVVRVDTKGNKKIYNCMSDVVNDGFNLGHVSNCCCGRRKTHKGFEWYFKDE